MEIRIDPKTNKTEIKLDPEGLPAIWIAASHYCDRCAPYRECLGLNKLTDQEWSNTNDFLLVCTKGKMKEDMQAL